jgi:prephenate dehydrogenase
VLTDVGSVKRSVVEAGERTVKGSGMDFVGSHPMAGSEMSGFEAARADLFDKAVCVVTPSESTPQEALARVCEFWRLAGCRVRTLDPAEHDRIVARVSHLPHLAAAALVCGALEGAGDNARFAGRGWVDSTRVASGDPGLWTEILLENRDAVLESARSAARSLAAAIALLESGDRAALLAFLERAKRLRDAGLKKSERGEEDAW